jgi:tryptophan-rich sensory protein
MNILAVNGRSSVKKFGAAMLLTLGAGALGALISANAGEIYGCLNLPAFAPPEWVFMPVWIILYILMGFSLYRLMLLDKTLPEVKNARTTFYTQLVFNLLWSLLFFGFSLRIAAFLDILILLSYIVLTMIKAGKLDRGSALLLLPYALWVAYAAVLNLGILLLNN